MYKMTLIEHTHLDLPGRRRPGAPVTRPDASSTLRVYLYRPRTNFAPKSDVFTEFLAPSVTLMTTVRAETSACFWLSRIVIVVKLDKMIKFVRGRSGFDCTFIFSFFCWLRVNGRWQRQVMREGGGKGLLKKIIEEWKRKSWIVTVFFFWFRWTEPRFVTPEISRRGIAVRHLPRKWQRSAQSGIVRYRKKHRNILVSFIIQIFYQIF